MIKKTANYINHIALVLDASGSMDHLRASVIRVADEQIRNLAEQSKKMDQETRVSVYTFDYPHNIQCVIFDKDVLRLPSIAGFYSPEGATALRDAVGKSIEDLQKTATMYGDHSFLLYVITDGLENRSAKYSEAALLAVIKKLDDNWTFGAFVPDSFGEKAMNALGFPVGNIVTWEATEKGLKDVGLKIQNTSASYMSMRSTGVRGTRNLFNMDAQGITSKDVKNLKALTPGQFRMIAVQDDEPIAEFVERKLRRQYRLGEAFYQLTKPETIQPQKQLALYKRKGHTVYTGQDARQLLNLPDYEVKVAPSQGGEYEIFVQSTSVNRKLIGGTNLLVLSQ